MVNFLVPPINDQETGRFHQELCRISNMFALTTGNVYYPNYRAVDQGVTGKSDTIKYAVDTIASDSGTIFLRHNSGSATTTYTLSTSEVIPANIHLIIEKGAIITIATGITLTIYSPANIVASPNQQIFSGTGTAAFTVTYGKIYPEWWYASGAWDTALAAAFAAAGTAGTVGLLPHTYAYSTGLSCSTNIIGSNRDSTILSYSGIGVALTLYGGSAFKGFQINTSDDAAIGILLTDGIRKTALIDFYITGNFAASNTGRGLNIAAVAAWLGGIDLQNVEIQGYKYGIYCSGTSAANTMSVLTGTNVWLVGRTAGVIANSIGIFTDAWTNGVGSIINGGTIEGFNIGILVMEGNAGCGFGISYYGDFEANNTNWTLGKTFNGIIFDQNAGSYTRQGTNAAANKWFQDYHLSGEIIKESHYSQRHVTYTGSGGVREFSYYRGNSIIDGGGPFLVGGFFSYGTEAYPQQNYLSLGSHKMSWGSAAPIAGTWARGDVVWNTGAAGSGSPGWVCTTAGTPGTWKAIANLAA